ncbi:phosphoglucose isomerase [Helicosporidium sp. ATCC 50920]|nr:phosphoglucose isomerase [Helicosporidium sp. ATCC 50920]|eukprot:KDD75199.1 phosphoglucose isomerase [Helicosporidium sp. ATCC 50920]
MGLMSDTAEWKALEAHAEANKKQHLRDLVRDEARCKALMVDFDDISLDLTRQNATEETLELLLKLAAKAGVESKIEKMLSGRRINTTENRAVLHTALRAPRDAQISEESGSTNVVSEVWRVLDQIDNFSTKVREGEFLGYTGKTLTDVVAIGIGGSYLGPLFVHEALRSEPAAAAAARDRGLHFIANVDPVDAVRTLETLDPERTLVVVVSKTFTTAETMRNAKAARGWLMKKLDFAAVSKHMVAVSSNTKAAMQFGIHSSNVFEFWDWVGGRYSVCSAVGLLPLALQYGFPIVRRFLEGARAMDDHFAKAPARENLPVLMGLFCVWNATFLKHAACAVLPYATALGRLPAHVQQLSMESNGKGVDLDGRRLPFAAGEIDFGEPGTNGQHSFYQLLHQGRVVPAEFIGAAESQQDWFLPGETDSAHAELLSNFFAQPDALALGKTPSEVVAEGASMDLGPHKTFEGNRPSLSLLLPRVDAYTVGQLLALYEHRVAVAGFLWGINSFDQWGVELGKALATRVRSSVALARGQNRVIVPEDGFLPATTRLLNKALRLAPAVPVGVVPEGFAYRASENRASL